MRRTASPRLAQAGPIAAWSALAFDSWALAWESSAVIGLRLAQVAGGGSGTFSEITLMASEKISAAMELHASLVAAGLATTPLESAQQTVRLYRRKVRANRRRLTRTARSRVPRVG